MAAYYIPARDGDFLLWAQNFSTKVTATPTVFGLTSGQATALATSVATFSSALTAATTPATRTRVTVAAKDTARADLQLLIQQYAAIVQGFPTITPAQLSSLGLTVRNTTRTPVPPPATFPLVDVVSSNGFVLTLSVRDQSTPAARKRPFGTVGAEVYLKLGTTPPVGIADCVFQGMATRYPARFPVASSEIGKTAYLLSRWINRRGEPGPLSAVATTVVAN